MGIFMLRQNPDSTDGKGLHVESMSIADEAGVSSFPENI
jgi:hypothetical protein